MHSKSRILIAFFFFAGLFCYFFSFRVSLGSALIGIVYFLLIVALGKWLPRLIRLEDNLFFSWIIPAFTGLGCFQLLWFAAKLLHVHPLIPLLPVSLVSFFWSRSRSSSGLKPEQENTESAFFSGKHERNILLAALLICVSVTYFPFRNFGLRRDGTYRYRASFWAVSMKHLAVINILKGDYPFENPYFKGRPFHYYYLSYTYPSVLHESGVSTLEAFYLYHAAVAYLFVLLALSILLFLIQRFFPALLLTMIFIYSLSIEGIYLILAHFKEFLRDPLFFRGEFHLDGVSQFFFPQLPIDTLHRAILFTPMHLLSLSFLMLGLFFLRIRKAHWAPFFMTFSFLSSFFIGSLGFIFLGINLLLQFFKRSFDKKTIFNLLFFGLGSIIFVKVFRMLEGSGTRVYFYLPPLGKLAVVVGLNFGLVFLLALAGFGFAWFREKDGWMLLLLISLAVGFIASFFLWITPLNNEVPIKLCLVLQWLLIMGMVPLLRKRVWIYAAGLILLAGLPTYLGDIYASADITHPQATLRIPEKEMSMARWISLNLPKDAVVQTYPTVREEFFSLIPTFAERSMGVGDKMHGTAFQVPENEYMQKLEIVENALRRINDADSVRLLKSMGIGYILYGERESRVMPFPANLPLCIRFQGTYLFQLK